MGRRTRKSVAALAGRLPACDPARPRSAGAGFGSEGRRRAAWNRTWAPRPSGHGMRPVGDCWGAREGYVGTSRGGRRRVSESRRRYPNRDGLSRAAHGRYAHGAAGGEAALHAERLRCCAARPSEEGGRLLTGINEKDERRELLDAVADAGRLARGLDQLLESMAHADQLDPLDVEGILALRSISERCAERIEDAARILEAAERGLLCRTLNAARRKGTLRSRRGSRRVARPASSILAGARNWGALGQLSPLMVSSSSTM